SGATVNINDNANGANLGSGVLVLFSTTPPTLTGTAQPGGTGLLPYATVTTPTGPDFATYDAAGGTGLRAYTGFGSGYATTVASLSSSFAGHFRPTLSGLWRSKAELPRSVLLSQARRGPFFPPWSRIVDTPGRFLAGSADKTDQQAQQFLHGLAGRLLLQ